MPTRIIEAVQQPIWVIKIGGSLLGDASLIKWLEVIVAHGDGQLIIVPGGSVFADTVRDAQQLSQVSDAVAHHLALLAMDQFAHLLVGMHPQLVTAKTELELAERGWQHRGIVWLPSEMLLADKNIPKTWQVTSDSLSAWLANKLGAAHLLIVKSREFSDLNNAQQRVSAQHLIQGEWLDAQFTHFAHDKPYQTWLMHKDDYVIFNQGFSVEILQNNCVEVVI